jgi:hypothetical protein
MMCLRQCERAEIWASMAVEVNKTGFGDAVVLLDLSVFQCLIRLLFVFYG